MPPESSNPEPAAPSVGAQAEAFALDPEPKRKELTAAQLGLWSKLYAKGGRQLRRWWKEGAPLDHPELMPAWWTRTHTWSVPDALLAAAKPIPAASASPAAAVPEPQPLAAPVSASINLEDFDPEEGDRLRELKQIQAARFAQLKDALRAGSDTALLESKYVKLCETIDKMETRVAERLKKRGLFIFRPDVERDLAKAAEMIRQMSDSEARRLIERCPSLTPAARDELIPAIRDLSEARARVFRMLASFKTTDDALLQLTAA